MIQCTLCYLERDKQYLMLHRVKKKQDINAGKWIGVGGHIEEGESPEECVIREVREETGLTLHSVTLRGIVDFINDSCESEIMYLYTSDDFAGEVTECDEGILRWIPISEVEDLPIWEGDRIFLKDLREKQDFFHLQLNYHGDELLSHRYLPRIVLASASPRRKELLEQIGILPEIHPSHIQEEITTDIPDRLVESLSAQKAMDMAAQFTAYPSVTIGADTVVSVDGRILGKPKDPEEACEMIHMLQGRTHQVYTGVTLIYQDGAERLVDTFSECTDVTVYPMSDKEIRLYTDGTEPMDKAGAYGIQGSFAAYIQKIHGDYTNVVGLPVGPLWQHLKKLIM